MCLLEVRLNKWDFSQTNVHKISFSNLGLLYTLELLQAAKKILTVEVFQAEIVLFTCSYFMFCPFIYILMPYVPSDSTAGVCTFHTFVPCSHLIRSIYGLLLLLKIQLA